VEELGQKPVPVSLYPKHISNGLTIRIDQNGISAISISRRQDVIKILKNIVINFPKVSIIDVCEGLPS
jgi:hypothetical protein